MCLFAYKDGAEHRGTAQEICVMRVGPGSGRCASLLECGGQRATFGGRFPLSLVGSGD